MHYVRKQIISTDHTSQSQVQTARPHTRMGAISPPKNKGVFSIKPIKFVP